MFWFQLLLNVEQPLPRRYVVLADYAPLGPTESALKEGDIVDLVRVGCAGWWYVRPSGETKKYPTIIFHSNIQKNKFYESALKQVNFFRMLHIDCSNSSIMKVTVE